MWVCALLILLFFGDSASGTCPSDGEAAKIVALTQEELALIQEGRLSNRTHELVRAILEEPVAFRRAIEGAQGGDMPGAYGELALKDLRAMHREMESALPTIENNLKT